MKNYLYSLLVIIVACVAGSLIFDVAYVHTFIGLLIWSLFGHFITLDDDMPGGWGNLDGEKKVWYGSLWELALKFFLLVAIGFLYYFFPGLAEYGA